MRSIGILGACLFLALSACGGGEEAEQNGPATQPPNAAYAIGRLKDAEDPAVTTTLLTRIDLATGAVEVVSELAVKDSNSSEPTDTFRPLLLTTDALHLGRTPRGGTLKLEQYDLDTGAVVGFIDAGNVGSIATNGIDIYAESPGGVSRADPATNTWSTLIENGTTWTDLGPVLDFAGAIVTEDGEPLGSEDVESIDRLLGLARVELDNAVITEDSVWFIASDFGFRTDDGRSGILEAVARYSLESGALTGWYPTDELGAHFLPPDATFDVVTLGDASMVMRDGFIFIDDSSLHDDREGGSILRLDPDAGILTRFYTPDLEGADFYEIELVNTDPESLWVNVERHVLGGERSDGTRRSTFDNFATRIDTTTGEVLVSADIREGR